MKSLSRTVARLLLVAQFWQPIALRAEDIDIFTGGSIAASNPSILFVLDNTSNWSLAAQKWPGGIKQGQSEANAIKTLLTDANVINSGINLGLMEFISAQGLSASTYTGGFVRYPISVMNSANKAAFSAKLTTIYNNYDDPDEKRNSGTKYGWLLADVYNYLTGGAAYNNNLTLTNPPMIDAASAAYTVPYSTFLSPITQSNGCGRIFQVFIGNPDPNGPTADGDDNKAALAALGCDTTTINVPNFTSTTVGAGTSDLGYAQSCTTAAAVTSDYTSCSDGTYDSCAVDTTRFTNVAACAAGTQRYMVTKTTTTAAATTTLGTTSDCVASCSTTDYAACSDGTSYPGGCSCPSSVATCPTGKQRYTVTETTTGGTTSLLGVTSKCKTSAASWAEAYVDFPTCVAADNVCSQTGAPTTSGGCPSGTARYLMQDVSSTTSSAGPTDACYSSAPAASATSLAATCSASGASCASPVTTGSAGACVSGQRYMVQNSLAGGATSTVGPTASCYAAAPGSVPSDMTTACASGTCATPVATTTSGSCPAGTQRYMITSNAETTDFVLTPVTGQALICSGKNGTGPATAVTTVSSPPAGTSYASYKWLNTTAQGSCANASLTEWKPVAVKTVATDMGYSATCGASAGAVSTTGYTGTALLVDGSRTSASPVSCPGTLRAYNYTLTSALLTNKGYTLACYASSGAAATTGYAANSGAGNSLVISSTNTSTGSLACSGGNISGSYNAYNFTKTSATAVNKGYTLACYSSAPSVAEGSTGYTFSNTATVSSTTSTGTLACPSGYRATQITNTATGNVSTTLGTTNTCTSAAPTSFPDFPTSCTGAGISCSAGTPTSTSCPSGESTYTVQGTGVASSATTDLGYTTSCYASAGAASTADYSAQCSGSGVSCQIDAARSTTTSTSNCAANTYRYMVTGSTLGTVTSVPTGTYSTPTKQVMADEWARCLYQKDLSPEGASATAEQFTADFSTSGAIVGADTITFDGATTTLAGGESATDIATKVAASTYTNWTATSSGPVVTFVNFSTGPVTHVTSGNFTIVDAGSTGTMPAVVVVTTVTGANATGGALGRQNVTTYTIDVYNAKQSAEHTAYLMSMAQQGGGRYFSAKSEAEILTALKQIISEIQSVNTAFAAASIPLSTTNRSQNLNEVYIGVFRPSLEPRWFGNLKKFKIATTSTGIDLVDSLGTTALNSQTGFLNDCAVSYWTSDSGVWWDQVKIGALNLSSNALLNPVPKSSCVAMPAANTSTWSDLPDGQSVEKGAVAGVIRRGNTTSSPTWQVNRTIYTRSGSSLTPLTAALAGGDTDLYNYIRGVDIDVDGKHRTEKSLSSAIANVVRPSVHGDVVHSRPLAVNYGANDTVVYYGSNDGMMRAVNGLTGEEKWAFIPIEFLDVAKQTRLMQDTPYIAFGASPASGSVAKDYLFDGSAGLYQSITNKVWLYPTQRRGGRMVHALNVSNHSEPRLLWYKGCPNLSNDTSCSAGFDDIGQTWSIPVVTKIKGYVDGGGVPKPVVVFGGGYDTCEDVRPAANPPTWACSTGKGRAVFVVDAEDGTLLKKFTITGMRGVTAGISFTDINNDGYSDYAYVADLGGSIYRLSFIDNPSTMSALEKDDWSIKKVAYTSGVRKFMFSPAVTFAGGTSVYVALGSGDRERPLESDYPYQMNVKNYIYGYRDILDDYDAVTTACNLDGDPSAVGACVLDYSTSPATCDSPNILPAGGKQAWRVGMSYQGEQTVTQAIILGGMVSLNTTRPDSAGVCSAALGEGGGYFLNLLNGSGAIGVEGNCGGSVRGKFTGVGLPTDPVVVNLPGEDPLCIGCVSKSNDNPNLGSKLFQPTAVRPPISKIKTKKYRYTVVD